MRSVQTLSKHKDVKTATLEPVGLNGGSEQETREFQTEQWIVGKNNHAHGINKMTDPSSAVGLLIHIWDLGFLGL